MSQKVSKESIVVGWHLIWHSRTEGDFYTFLTVKEKTVWMSQNSQTRPSSICQVTSTVKSRVHTTAVWVGILSRTVTTFCNVSITLSLLEFFYEERRLNGRIFFIYTLILIIFQKIGTLLYKLLTKIKFLHGTELCVL